MYFPRAACSDPKAEVEPIAQSVPRGGPSETILVVEDDPDVRRYSMAALRDLGYRVLAATDASTALDIIASEPGLDLLFSDIGLPGGMDGRVLATRAQQWNPNLKVLLTTAYTNIDVQNQGGQPVKLLPKPFTIASLATTVRHMLDGVHAADPGGR
jgi:CheY-like chemotaxis protein